MINEQFSDKRKQKLKLPIVANRIRSKGGQKYKLNKLCSILKFDYEEKLNYSSNQLNPVTKLDEEIREKKINQSLT